MKPIRRSLASLVLAGLTAAVSLLPATATADAAPSIESLRWMAGHWVADADGVKTEEGWFAPDGGLMVGVHREVRTGRKAWFEFLRIVADEQGIAYLAMPAGRPATRFPLRELGDRRVVFEKPDHDFPQRIVYWAEGNGVLHARVEGTVDGKSQSQQWRWTRK